MAMDIPTFQYHLIHHMVLIFSSEEIHSIQSQTCSYRDLWLVVPILLAMV